MKWMSEDNLAYFWSKLKALLAGKVDKVPGKQLSTEDYTTAEKTKLASALTTANIVDNLTSTSTTDALSAHMGRKLNSKFTTYVGTASGSSRQEFVTNLLPLINTVFNISNLANGTVIAGSATWSNNGYVSWMVTRTAGGANIVAQSNAVSVTGSFNPSTLALITFEDLNSNIATYDFGTTTLANLQTAIVTYAATLADGTVKNISFLMNETVGRFSQTRYIGQLIKTNNNRINIEVRQALNDIRSIIGKYTNGTWEWDQTAVDTNITSAKGGVPKRIAGVLAAGESVSLRLVSSFSSHSEFALLGINTVGNGLAGAELLYLGPGTYKKKALLGEMNASNYTLAYSSPNWTLTNNSSTNIYYCFIASST